MPTDSATGTGRRRRGAVLEAAILDAGWEQIHATGVAGFTIDAVAARAHTSKPVLYRRWSCREELLVAVLHRQLAEHPLAAPDTGSLRGDVIGLLHEASEKRARIIAVLGGVGVLFDHPSMSFSQVREQVIEGLPMSMTRVLERARERGELAAELPERVAGLPFELLRGRLLATGRELTGADIDSIVDEVFLPLVRAYQ